MKKMNDDKIRPTRWWYLLSVAIFVTGFSSWCISAFALFSGIKKDIQRVVIPGIHHLELSRPGKYIIYHEYQTIVDDNVVWTNKCPGDDLLCTIRPTDVNDKMVVSEVGPYSTYDFGGCRRGVSIFEFKIERPGSYVLEVKYVNGKQKPQIVLAVGRSLSEYLLVPGLFLALLTIVTIILSVGIFFAVFLRRRKARKRLLRSQRNDPLLL